MKSADVKNLKWEVVLRPPDKVNIPCLVHDTRLCQIDVWNKTDVNTKHNYDVNMTLAF